MSVTIDGGAGVTTNTGAVYNSIQSGTSVASTSGTSIDFTSIPSWVKRITVMFSGVGTSGSSLVILRLGTSSGIETSGYLGNTAQLVNTATSANLTHSGNNGIVTDGAANSAAIRQGAIFISLLNTSTNTWAISGNIGRSDANTCSTLGGIKPLAATLDRVRITTVNGTDTFNAGSVNILYE